MPEATLHAGKPGGTNPAFVAGIPASVITCFRARILLPLGEARILARFPYGGRMSSHDLIVSKRITPHCDWGLGIGFREVVCTIPTHSAQHCCGKYHNTI